MSMRQPAVRTFAMEYNDSTTHQREEGQYSPNFVVTPLGGMINRLFVVGVLLEVTEVGNTEEPFIIGRISDPSGSTFRVSAGSKRSDMQTKLKKLEPPCFVAVIGKSDLYNPEVGVYRLSIDPEVIHQVDDEARSRWILDTAKATRDRLDCFLEARKMSKPSIEELVKLNFSRQNAQGALVALENYSFVDVQKYARGIHDALTFILPEFRNQKEDIVKTSPPSGSKTEESVEERLLELIGELSSGKEDGVPWDTIVEEAVKRGISEIQVEEGYVSLRDKGEILEPSIGMLKTV
ncbi:MAG TPA: hypothetical protein ENN76_00760 [Euryarchaeota archaeon]|nr:hypothetical protein [Euryarchaeota archaeon]